mmetsp:Transcript_41517/g.137577  ORF Transcript_41517/g.137577 Transcript_41517/m.137577 type:complete len:457 (-) Transcript_41517:284-1654(-)
MLLDTSASGNERLQQLMREVDKAARQTSEDRLPSDNRAPPTLAKPLTHAKNDSEAQHVELIAALQLQVSQLKRALQLQEERTATIEQRLAGLEQAATPAYPARLDVMHLGSRPAAVSSAPAGAFGSVWGPGWRMMAGAAVGPWETPVPVADPHSYYVSGYVPSSIRPQPRQPSLGIAMVQQPAMRVQTPTRADHTGEAGLLPVAPAQLVPPDAPLHPAPLQTRGRPPSSHTQQPPEQGQQLPQSQLPSRMQHQQAQPQLEGEAQSVSAPPQKQQALPAPERIWQPQSSAPPPPQPKLQPAVSNPSPPQQHQMQPTPQQEPQPMKQQDSKQEGQRQTLPPPLPPQPPAQRQLESLQSSSPASSRRRTDRDEAAPQKSPPSQAALRLVSNERRHASSPAGAPSCRSALAMPLVTEVAPASAGVLSLNGLALLAGAIREPPGKRLLVTEGALPNAKRLA